MNLRERALDPQTKAWRLRRAEFFATLSDVEIRDLGAFCHVAVVERGAMVYDAGDRSGHLYLLDAGAVKLSRVADHGKEVNIAVLGPGELFGELALVDERLRADSAQALDDAVVFGLPADAFAAFLATHPPLALATTRLMGRRLRRVEGRIQDILFKNVRTRLAHKLAGLAGKFGDPVPEGTRIGMRLTQTDLAQLISSTRETTSTIFNEFRRRGLVDTDGPYIIVRDVDRLARY